MKPKIDPDEWAEKEKPKHKYHWVEDKRYITRKPKKTHLKLQKEVT
jgi:hypothetical protein